MFQVRQLDNKIWHIPEICSIIASYTGDIRTMFALSDRAPEDLLLTQMLCYKHALYATRLIGPLYDAVTQRLHTFFDNHPAFCVILYELQRQNFHYDLAGSFVLALLENVQDYNDVDIFINSTCPAPQFAQLGRDLAMIQGINHVKPMLCGYHDTLFRIMYIQLENGPLINIIHGKRQSCRRAAAWGFDLDIVKVFIDHRFKVWLLNPYCYFERQIFSTIPFVTHSCVMSERDLVSEGPRIMTRVRKYKRRGYILSRIRFVKQVLS